MGSWMDMMGSLMHTIDGQFDGYDGQFDGCDGTLLEVSATTAPDQDSVTHKGGLWECVLIGFDWV